jgi:PEP-CTERM motif
MTKLFVVMLVSGAVIAVFGGRANAQSVLFSDTFNRADSRDIQASLTGITDNTGSSLAADGVYSQPWLDPNNAAPTYGVQDGVAANGGGAQILSSQLQLAVGAGTSDAYVNHNFVNASILSADGFSISLDVGGYTQTGYQQGGAFALGMSASEAASAGDAFDENPSMTGAFNDGSTIGLAPPGTVVSDFWLALRGNNTLAWGSGSGTISGVTGLSAKIGTISANFSFGDFNAGSTVNYEVFLNGVSEGTGSFTWSGTDENYIGIDARDSGGVSFDNFSVSAVPEPSTVALVMVGAAGWLIRRRKA